MAIKFLLKPSDTAINYRWNASDAMVDEAQVYDGFSTAMEHISA